jgi:hypothetical protein
MDRNLNDDMVKLVRYSIVNIARDQERILHKGEQLVTDNMTDDSFASWMIASYLQSPEAARHPGEVSHEQKKYLRVFFEVLSRWAKQDRKYEERQLRVLSEIRDAIEDGRKPSGPPGGQGKPDAWSDLEKRLDANKLRLKYLRQGFRLCSEQLGTQVAETYGRFRDWGDFVAMEVDAAQLQDAFAKGIAVPFDAAGLESFPGRWRGVNKSYDLSGKEMEAEAGTWNMTWEKGVHKGDRYVQRVVGSMQHHYASNAIPDLTERKVDLALNVYDKDIGITGWLTMWSEVRNELALISYQLNDKAFLWIGQVLTDKLEPVMGEKVFWMFLEWLVPEDKAYYMYGLMFEIDFDACRASLFGERVRKSRFDLVG